MIKDHEKIYTILFLSSLCLYLVNFLIQGQIVFGYNDPLGLIFRMKGIFWIGFFLLLVLIYFHFSYFTKIDEKFVFLTFTLLLIYTIGTPIFYEHLPTFQDTWSHSFLADNMFKTGRVINLISSYEQYPGSFLFYGLLFQMFPSYGVMSYFPIFIYILGMLVIYLLLKILINAEISFLSSALYVFFNWTVEDHHLSPQFLMLFIYFCFMFILIKILTDKKNRKKYFLFYLIIIPAIVFSHPGLPIFLFFILGSMMILCKKLRFTLLLILIILGISFTIHTVLFTTEIGSYITFIDNFVESLMSGRLSQTTQSFETSFLFRRIFLYSRLSITSLSIIFGILGLIIMWKKKYYTGAKFFFAWSFSMILFAGFVGIVLKGEYYERFALISSLPLSVLTVYFVSKARIPIFFVLVMLLALTPLYFIGKYGNEAFESISSEKLRADCFYFNVRSDCEERNEVVDTRIYYDLDEFGSTYFHISREELIATSIFEDKNVEEVIEIIDKTADDLMLDKVYSNYNAWVFTSTQKYT